MSENPGNEIPQDISKLTKILDRGNEKQLTQDEIKAALADLKAAMKDNKALQGEIGAKFAQEYLDFKKDGKVNNPILPRGNQNSSISEPPSSRVNESSNVAGNKPVNWERQGVGDLRETFDLAMNQVGERFSYEITKPVADLAGDTEGGEETRHTLIHTIAIKLDGKVAATILAPKFPGSQNPPYIMKITTHSGETEVYGDKNGKHSSENIQKTLIKSLRKLLPQ